MIIVVYDNLDDQLGNYFEQCALELLAVIPKHLEQRRLIIFGEQLNPTNLELQLSQINCSGFLFAAYSHGHQRALTARSVAYMQCGLNTRHLKNACIFTIACLAASDFGKETIENGAKAFMGYNGEVEGILAEDYRNTSIRCDNYPVILFLNGYSVEESVIKSKEFITQQIDKITPNNPLVASILLNNRDALVTLGEKDLKLKDLLTS